MRWLTYMTVIVSVMCAGCDAETRTRLGAHPDYRLVPHHIVEAPQAKSAEMYFRMKKGRLTMGADSLALMVSKHLYKSPVRAPILEFTEVEDKAYLALTQESIPSIGVFAHGDAMNEWDVQLNPQLPLDLTLEFGRGQGTLDLHKLNLDRLRIYNEEGDLDIDLTAKELTGDISIWMNNHRGNIRLKLPAGAGAQITTIRGAEITAEHFTRDKAIFTNERYEEAEHRIFVDVQSLSGKVIIQ